MAFLLIILVAAHVWPFSLAEKKNAFVGKRSRGSICRALLWRTTWRTAVFILVPAFVLMGLVAMSPGQAEEAGEIAGAAVLIWILVGLPYALVRSYWVSRYFKLPEPSEEPPPVDGKEPAIYVFQNDKKTGPFTKAQFKQMFEAGMVDARAKYWHAGMDGWKDVIPSP